MRENSDFQLQRFQEAAANFVDAVDSASRLQPEEFLSRVSLCLAELYTSALQLPEVVPDTDNIEDSAVSTEEWAKLYESLRAKLGALDTYWSIFDSTEKSDPLQACLSSDISEIYRDIQDSQQLLKKNISHADLLWELREAFREHWSRHALEVLKAIRDHHL